MPPLSPQTEGRSPGINPRGQLKYPLDLESEGALKRALENVEKDVIRKRNRAQTTLLSGATSFNVASDYMVMTAQAAVTIDKIGGGREGQILTLEFTDTNITITDTGTGAEDTVNLRSAFTSTANDVLQLLYDGTSWREVGRGSGGGGGTLDQSYDEGGAGAGRTITADSGAVEITVPDTSNNAGLVINQNDATNDPMALSIITASGSSTDPTVGIQSTNSSTVGPKLDLFHNSVSPSTSDFTEIRFYANNDAAAKSELASIQTAWNTTTGGEGTLRLRAKSASGSNTTLLRLFGDISGIGIGNSSAAGILYSNGNQDLILQTGNATTGTITITDGANGDITLAPNGTGDVALGTADLTMTGSLAATGARVTKGWFTDLESTNMPTVGGTAILSSLTAPQFTTIELGHATDTTLSRSAAGVLAVEGVVIPSISSTSTLTNKDISSSTNTYRDLSVRASTASSNALTANTWFTIPLNLETFDTDTMHDTVTNNSRITFTTAGKYQINGWATFTANKTHGLRILLNGSTVIAKTTAGNALGGEEDAMSISTMYSFSASNYVELQAITANTSTSVTTAVFDAFKVN